ncbi:MYND finger domain-containing protein, putative [Babesia ovis]|uniref:MYND finger domain-containing protein, putative n=1 Tax=Babesia ovis TaxID=5869 RepID=A0A9W5T7R8_BABOV|nr:MYND finger domain-containing protein, putative [Babesia ovis]
MGLVSFRHVYARTKYEEDNPAENTATSVVPPEEPDKDVDIEYLKELFFHSKLRPALDWAGLCLNKQHDFKFWANVSHSLGLFVLKSIFNADIPFEDSRVLRGVPSPDTGSVQSVNYIEEIKVRTSFVLLSGMLANRIPGSLRLIVRCNGYQYFEHRVSTIMREFPNFDVEALCFNMNALRTLLPFLQECQPVKLSNICHRFITSAFWRLMWLEVGVHLKDNPNTQRSQLFCTFLELASTICFGARSPTLLKRLFTSCLDSLWDPICSVLSWRVDPKVSCRVVTFIADLLIMGHQDGCIDLLTKQCLSKLMNFATKAHSAGEKYLDRYATQTLDEKNEFYHHYAVIAVEMLDDLAVVLKGMLDGSPDENMHLLYDISSLGTAKMTLPPCEVNDNESGPRYDYSDTRVFPRVLPCFNVGCKRVFHLDMPELHLEGDFPDFSYCDRCGITTYCSPECATSHWDSSHKDICAFLRAPPTFARFVPAIHEDGVPILQTIDECWMTPFVDDDGTLLTLF